MLGWELLSIMFLTEKKRNISKKSDENLQNGDFRRKKAVPAIFRKFQLQKSVQLTIEPCLMVGIVISNVFK